MESSLGIPNDVQAEATPSVLIRHHQLLHVTHRFFVMDI